MSENVIPEKILTEIPVAVRDEARQLPRENQELFTEGYRKKKKNVLIAYLLCLLYGTHNVYLEKTDLAFWFWLTAGAFLIWWVIEFFRIPGMVREYNRSVARVMLADVRTEKYQPLI
jgi:hypothetical protein